MSNKPWENKFGLSDPTAYAATRPLTEEEKLVAELVKILKTTASLTGFDITNRIELRSRKTGRMYR